MANGKVWGVYISGVAIHFVMVSLIGTQLNYEGFISCVQDKISDLLRTILN